ncbi:MAG TPA: hypothetical protein VF310_15955, partial [Vicinamibacteria bacterium]
MRRVSWRRLALAAALAAQGCAVHSAPPGWLPAAKDLPRWCRGAWIDVDPGPGRKIVGELIAVGPDGIHVLTEAGLRAVPAAEI